MLLFTESFEKTFQEYVQKYRNCLAAIKLFARETRAIKNLPGQEKVLLSASSLSNWTYAHQHG